MNMRVSGAPLNGLNVQPSPDADPKKSTSTSGMVAIALLLLEATAMSDSDSSGMGGLDGMSGLGGMGGLDGLGQGGQGGGGSPSFQKLEGWQPGQTDKAGESTVQGDPPADLAPPEGTTAGDLYSKNPKVFDDINKMKWKGEPEGDTFAKSNGFKNFEDMKNSDSPEAAKAMAKLQWVGTAANNAKIDDSKGSHARSKDLQGGGLTGIRGSGEVDPDSTAAIAQDYIVHGQSMNGKTTHETDRVYADGTCKSNAQIVGKKIGDAIGKVLPFVKGISDAALDGEDEHHAKSVDDTITAKEAHARVKKDVGNIFKGVVETAAMFVPGGQAVGLAARAIDEGIELGTTAARGIGQAARGTGSAGRGAEDAGQAARGAGEAGRGAEGAGRGAEGAGQAGRTAADPASTGQWDKVLRDLRTKLKEVGESAPPITMQTMAKSFIKNAIKNELKSLAEPIKQQIEQALDQAFDGDASPQNAEARGDVPAPLPPRIGMVQQPVSAAG